MHIYILPFRALSALLRPFLPFGIRRSYRPRAKRTTLLRLTQRSIATELHSEFVGISTVTVAILRDDGVYRGY